VTAIDVDNDDDDYDYDYDDVIIIMYTLGFRREEEEKNKSFKYSETQNQTEVPSWKCRCFLVQRGGGIRHLPDVTDFASPADMCLLRASFSRENVRRNDHSLRA